MIYNKLAVESKLIGKYYEELRRSDKLLGQIKTCAVIHNGGVIYDKKDNGKRHKSELHKLSSSITLKRDLISNYLIEDFSLIFYELIGAQIEEAKKMIFEETRKITEFTGNVIEAKGGIMDGDIVLDMIEKISISFDKDGNPNLPQFFCGSEMFNQFKDFKFSPNQEQRLKTIIESQKNNWHAKKCYRRLSYVD